MFGVEEVAINVLGSYNTQLNVLVLLFLSESLGKPIVITMIKY